MYLHCDVTLEILNIERVAYKQKSLRGYLSGLNIWPEGV